MRTLFVLLGVALTATACSSSVETGGGTGQKTAAPAPSATATDAGAQTPAPAVDGGTSTSATQGDDVCAADAQDQACDQCVKKSCCTQLRGCYSDAQCAALDECAYKCYEGVQNPGPAQETCVNNCKAKSPAVKAKFEAIDACVASACAAACN